MEIKIEIKEFAKKLAGSDDFDQAELINEFSRELKVCCKDVTLDRMQPCNISDKLDSNGVDLIKSLYAFIKLREETEPK